MHWETVEGHLKFRLATTAQLTEISLMGREPDLYKERLSTLIQDRAVFVATINEVVAGYSVFYPIKKLHWVCERFFTAQNYAGCGVPSFLMDCMCDLAIYETKKHYNLTLVSGLEVEVRIPRRQPHSHFNNQLVSLGFERFRTADRSFSHFRRILEDGFFGAGAYRSER